MKKSIIILLMGTLLLTGCGKKEEIPTEDFSINPETSIQENGEDIAAKVSDYVYDDSINIQQEIDVIQTKSDEFSDKDWSQFSEDEVVNEITNWSKLWDDEVNILVERLNNELPEEQKESFMNEQDTWSTLREHNAKIAGIEAYGSTMQSVLENTKSLEMTMTRVYKLASQFATNRGQSFEISEVIQDTIAFEENTVSDEFEKYKGQWKFGQECIIVQPFSESEFMADDFAGTPDWVVSVSHGVVLTDLDVYGYSMDGITFCTNNDSSEYYYQLRTNINGKVELASGSNLYEMNDVITCD